MSDEVTIWSWKSEDGETQEIHSGELAFGNYNGSCEAALLADEAVLAEQAAWEQNLLNPELSVRETIEEASLDGDQWKVIIVFSTEDTREVMETSAYEYEEGDILINVYTLEADTLFLLELSEAVKKTDGTTEEYGVQKITYDTEMTDEMKDLYQKMNEEPLRTVSIVLDPDTDQEKTYSATLTQGIPVYLYCPENYELYTDRACTQVDEAESGDTTQSVTIYSKAKAE